MLDPSVSGYRVGGERRLRNLQYYGVTLGKRLEFGAWYLRRGAFPAIMSFELHEALSARAR